MGFGDQPPLKVDSELLSKYGNQLLSEAGIGPAANQFGNILRLFQGVAADKTLGLVWFDIAQHDGPWWPVARGTGQRARPGARAGAGAEGGRGDLEVRGAGVRVRLDPALRRC